MQTSGASNNFAMEYHPIMHRNFEKSENESQKLEVDISSKKLNHFPLINDL